MQKIGRRSKSRLGVHLPARLITLHSTQDAWLKDLSQWGARVAFSQPVSRGERVVIQWDRFEMFGNVVWVSAMFCGIAAFDPVTTAILLATRELASMTGLQFEKETTRQAASAWAAGQVRL